MATLLQRQFSNRAYWEKREREAREKYLRTEAQQLAEIDKIYRQMYQWAEDEINRFYGKYAGIEGIDITDAKKRVSAEDVKAFEEKAAKYVKDRNFSDQASAELRLYNATMKINRLELLKAQIGLGLVDGFNEMDLYEESELTTRAIEEITRQAGILGTSLTEADTVARAKQIVNATFYNATFSQRIWSHCDNLSSAIAIELQKGLIAGVGSRQMATNLRKVYNVSVNDAHRLMVTELRRVQTDVALDSYKDANITQYMYMAVNPKACPICKRLNNKIYEVKGAEVGNPDHPLPPMHPRCHCTTAPWQDPAEYEAWLNWLESGGTTAEWDALPAAERARLINDTKPQEPASTQIEWSEAGEEMRNHLESANIKRVEVKRFDTQPTDTEIINRLAGGDQTKGSCHSVACAYIGNKMGLDVLDFRGGEAREAWAKLYSKIPELNGVNSTVVKDATITNSIKLLSKVEEGKEYLFVGGRHTSIVRRRNGELEYLELQAKANNGWKSFTKNDIIGTPLYAQQPTVEGTLKRRFGGGKRNCKYGYLVEADSLYQSTEFADLLSYVNTAESKQKKGINGTVK